MNTSADWDVIWEWQWFRRALWQPHYGDPEHPEGRPARTAPIWSWVLKENGASRILDCNCGLGLRTILLTEAGFDVLGTDSSAVAVGHARELAEARGLPIQFEHLEWDDLAARYDSEFDAVINDAFAWTLDRHELRFATHNFASVLKPGGILVFTGADQWSVPDDRPARLDAAWAAGPRFEIRADYGHDQTHMTLVVARDREEYGIVENYLFVVREADRTRLETATIMNSVQWTWDDYTQVCVESEFTTLESVRVPVGPREHRLNVARK